MPAMRPSNLKMKLSVIAGIFSGVCALSLFAETVDFSNAKSGQLPPHWTGTQTAKGQAKWSSRSLDQGRQRDAL